MSARILVYLFVFFVTTLLSGCPNAYYIEQSRSFAAETATLRDAITAQNIAIAESEKQRFFILAAKDNRCQIAADNFFLLTGPLRLSDVDVIVSYSEKIRNHIDGYKENPVCKAHDERTILSGLTNWNSGFRCFSGPESLCIAQERDIFLQAKIDASDTALKTEQKNATSVLNNILANSDPNYRFDLFGTMAGDSYAALVAYMDLLNEFSDESQFGTYSRVENVLDKFNSLKDKYNEISGFIGGDNIGANLDADKLTAGAKALDGLIGVINTWHKEHVALDKIRTLMKDKRDEIKQWLGDIMIAAQSSGDFMRISVLATDANFATAMQLEYLSANDLMKRYELLNGRDKMRNDVRTKLATTKSVENAVALVRQSHEHLVTLIVDNQPTDKDKQGLKAAALKDLKEALLAVKGAYSFFM